jgi:hypothetical protein
MKLLNNLVAIRPYPSDEIRLKDGSTLYLDIRFEEYLNAKTAGEVVAVPDSLRFDPKGSVTLDWDTDMELQVGDTVVFNYLAVREAMNTGVFLEDGVVLIPYDKIYTALRAGEVVCINGFILVEPEDEVVETFMEIPDNAILKSKQLGKVVYAGKPNRGYRIDVLLNGHTAPDDPVNVGDRVVFNWNDAIPIQPNAELRGEITRGLLYRMQHKDVHALVNHDSVVIA